MRQPSVIWVVMSYPNKFFDQTSFFFHSFLKSILNGGQQQMRAEGGTERANEVNTAEGVVCKVFYEG